MASEATKMAVKGKEHMDTRVTKVGDFKSGVMISEVVWSL